MSCYFIGNKTLQKYEKQKKEKRDRIEKMRKLKLEVVNCMAEVAQYLLANKNQEDYTKKKKIKVSKKFLISHHFEQKKQ